MTRILSPLFVRAAAAARKTDNKSGHTLKLPLKAAISPPFVVFTAKKQAASVRSSKLTEKPPPPCSCAPKRIRFARPHFSPPRQSLSEKHSRQLQCFFRRRCRAKPPASSRVNLPKVQRVSLPAANALRETRSPRVIAKAARGTPAGQGAFTPHPSSRREGTEPPLPRPAPTKQRGSVHRKRAPRNMPSA